MGYQGQIAVVVCSDAVRCACHDDDVSIGVDTARIIPLSCSVGFGEQWKIVVRIDICGSAPNLVDAFGSIGGEYVGAMYDHSLGRRPTPTFVEPSSGVLAEALDSAATFANEQVVVGERDDGGTDIVPDALWFIVLVKAQIVEVAVIEENVAIVPEHRLAGTTADVRGAKEPRIVDVGDVQRMQMAVASNDEEIVPDEMSPVDKNTHRECEELVAERSHFFRGRWICEVECSEFTIAADT